MDVLLSMVASQGRDLNKGVIGPDSGYEMVTLLGGEWPVIIKRIITNPCMIHTVCQTLF